MKDRINRRDFVARAAAVAGGIALGCSDANDPDPDPGPPSIDHIVVVTMENRSFDHLFGWVPGADGKQVGLSYSDANGVVHPTYHLTDTQSCEHTKPIHTFQGGRQEYNKGACDGWLRTPGNDLFAIGYYLGSDLPFLGKAATEWLVLDRYFSAIMGPTYPNRVISIAGETDRLANTLEVSTLPTIWDRLAGAGLTGKSYGATVATSILWGNRYNALMRPISEFYTDAASGKLPSVSFVDPDLSTDSGNSYHPPGDIRNGEAFIASVYKAVTASPQWSKSLMVLTFDEWGGFFDHVPPPVAQISEAERNLGNTDGLRGFRVPTILISPFVKRKSVSSRVYDHASVLRMIEARWNLQPLSVRDAQANNLMDEIDLTLPVVAAPVIDYTAGPFSVNC